MGKRKKNNYKALKEYDKKIIEEIKEITNCKDEICKKIIDSAINSRETTNEKEDCIGWIRNQFEPNTVFIDEDSYSLIFFDSLKTLLSQVKISFGTRKRNIFDALSNKITGYMAEYGIKLLSRKYNFDLKLAHEDGNPEDFYEKDFVEVFKNGKWRAPKLNIGAKGSGANALWLDIPESQFKKSHVHIFAKSLYDDDHLANYLFQKIENVFDEGIKKGFFENAEKEKIINAYPFKPIPVYVPGFVKQDVEDKEIKYSGLMGLKIYKIHEYRGFLPKNYEKIILEKEGLDENYNKIEFLSIGKFVRSDKVDLRVWNVGSIKKTPKEWEMFFNSI